MKKLLLTLLIFVMIGCSGEGEKKEVELMKLKKVVSVNYPLHYFAQRIGEDQIDAVLPVSPEGDPAYWQPDEKAIAVYQSADIILLNGADYAKWTKKVSLPTSKLVNTSKGFESEYIELHEGTTHSHGPEGEHEHLGYAFTTWLNFKYAVIQAEAVKDVLEKAVPDSNEFLKDNFTQLKTEIDKLNLSMNELSEKLKGSILFASHPVYQYLAEEYDLKIISEHWEPDQIPSDDQYSEFRKKLKKNPSKIMLWEDEPLPEVASQLNEMGIEVCVFNPCGNIPKEGDFISVMKKNISNLATAVIKE